MCGGIYSHLWVNLVLQPIRQVAQDTHDILHRLQGKIIKVSYRYYICSQHT